MKQHNHLPTAQIIPFPKRTAAASAQQNAARLPVYDDMPFAAVECGAGWYHDAAVEEAIEAQLVRFRKH